MKVLFLSILLVYTSLLIAADTNFYAKENFDLNRLREFEIRDSQHTSLKSAVNQYVFRNFDSNKAEKYHNISIPSELPEHNLDLSFFDDLDKEDPAESMIRKVIFQFFPQHMQKDFLPNSAQVKKIEFLDILEGEDLIPYLGQESFFIYSEGISKELETFTFQVRVRNANKRFFLETDKFAGKYMSGLFPGKFDDDEPIILTITFAPNVPYYGPSIVNIHYEYQYWKNKEESRSGTAFRLEEI